MQLRFHLADLGEPTDGTLRIIEVNPNQLNPEQRALLRRHLDDGCDCWQNAWTRLTPDGERTEFSTIARSARRLVAQKATLESLLEAALENERQLMATTSHSYATALH